MAFGNGHLPWYISSRESLPWCTKAAAPPPQTQFCSYHLQPTCPSVVVKAGLRLSAPRELADRHKGKQMGSECFVKCYDWKVEFRVRVLRGAEVCAGFVLLLPPLVVVFVAFLADVRLRVPACACAFAHTKKKKPKKRERSDEYRWCLNASACVQAGSRAPPPPESSSPPPRRKSRRPAFAEFSFRDEISPSPLSPTLPPAPPAPSPAPPPPSPPAPCNTIVCNA